MSKPFIKLLRSPYGYYFFEVNRNEIVSVDEDVHHTLEGILNGSSRLDDVANENDKIRRIMQMGYLSDFRPLRIHHPMADMLENFLAHKVEKITLQLTQNCNFRCSYCLYSGGAGDKQRSHTNVAMSLETAIKAVDFLYDHSRDARRINIGFYGGEPLLEFELLKRVVEYADDKFAGRDLTYNMTTNGSMLGSEIVEFCLDHKITVLISLDGPKEIHDKNRRLAHSNEGTFDLIVRNLQEVGRTHPEFLKQLSINMVMDPRNDADCTNQLFIDYDIFTRDRSSATIVDNKYSSENFDFTADFIAKNVYNRFLAFMYHFKRLEKDSVSPLALAALNRTNAEVERMGRFASLAETMAPGGPCLPGIVRTLVDVYGNLFPCERCSETASVMCIGSLDKGYDIDRAREILNIGSLTQEECRNCWALTRCQVCASQIEDGDSLSIEKKMKRCAEVRAFAAQDLLDMIMLREMGRIMNMHKGALVHEQAGS